MLHLLSSLESGLCDSCHLVLPNVTASSDDIERGFDWSRLFALCGCFNTHSHLLVALSRHLLVV